MKVIAKGIFKDGDKIFIWDGGRGVELSFRDDVIWGETIGFGKYDRAWGTPFIVPDN